jgi:hypothetical protein
MSSVAAGGFRFRRKVSLRLERSSVVRRQELLIRQQGQFLPALEQFVETKQ